MEVLRTKEALKHWTRQQRDKTSVLVPTMGALHRGHTSLMDLARERAGSGQVITSIFVNPTQFGPNEDLDAYPRQLEEDLKQCEAHGVGAVFVPEADDMYCDDASISIHESRLSRRLCGARRPGHFDGVCTIVAKLFLLTQPDCAVFGEKDFQQLAVIRRLARDLDFLIEIVGGPTVRESDGLAMSSRNAYLSTEEREQAPIIHQSLTSVATGISKGNCKTPAEARSTLESLLTKAPLGRIDYVDVVDSSTLEPLDSFGDALPRLLVAVFFGNTRLIDNVGVPQS